MAAVRAVKPALPAPSGAISPIVINLTELRRNMHGPGVVPALSYTGESRLTAWMLSQEPSRTRLGALLQGWSYIRRSGELRSSYDRSLMDG